MINKTKKGSIFFENLASKVTKAAGSTPAILLAFTSIIIWAILGPFFHFSDNWKWVISTGTTIITFLMVFLIQKSANKESLAVQLKLNELVAAHEFASNRLMDVENLTEEELKVIQKYHVQLRTATHQEQSLKQSHLENEAARMQELKKDIEEKINEEIKEIMEDKQK